MFIISISILLRDNIKIFGPRLDLLIQKQYISQCTCLGVVALTCAILRLAARTLNTAVGFPANTKLQRYVTRTSVEMFPHALRSSLNFLPVCFMLIVELKQSGTEEIFSVHLITNSKPNSRFVSNICPWNSSNTRLFLLARNIFQFDL